MTDKEINKIWDIIVDNYEKYLNNKGIKLSKLRDKNGYFFYSFYNINY